MLCVLSEVKWIIQREVKPPLPNYSILKFHLFIYSDPNEADSSKRIASHTAQTKRNAYTDIPPAVVPLILAKAIRENRETNGGTEDSSTLIQFKLQMNYLKHSFFSHTKQTNANVVWYGKEMQQVM